MNRKYRFYFKNATKQSVKSVIANKGHISYYFYMFLELLARTTLIFAPIFDLTNIALAKNIKNEGKVDALKALSTSNTFKSYWAIVLAHILKGLMFIAGLIMISIVTIALSFFGYGVATLSDNIQPALLSILFGLPGIIAILIYCIIFPIYFHPVTYIVATNPDLGFGGAMALCHKTMKKHGIGTYFACLIWPNLLNVAILFVETIALVILVLLANQTKNPQFLIILSMFLVLSQIIYICPVFDLTSKVARVWLLDDIVNESSLEVTKETTRGIYVKNFKTDEVGINNLKNNLIRLFDKTEDEENDVVEKTNTSEETVVENKTIEEEKHEEVLEETPVEEPVVEEVSEETSEEENPEEDVEETKAQEDVLENKETEEKQLNIIEKQSEAESLEEITTPVVEEKAQEETVVEEEIENKIETIESDNTIESANNTEEVSNENEEEIQEEQPETVVEETKETETVEKEEQPSKIKETAKRVRKALGEANEKVKATAKKAGKAIGETVSNIKEKIARKRKTKVENEIKEEVIDVQEEVKEINNEVLVEESKNETVEETNSNTEVSEN